jgi:hypothetical protein
MLMKVFNRFGEIRTKQSNLCHWGTEWNIDETQNQNSKFYNKDKYNNYDGQTRKSW